MSPLAPLLHSQHKLHIPINDEAGSACIAIIFLTIICGIAVLLTYCSRNACRRKIQKAAPVNQIPQGTRLFTLDGREIIIV